MMPPTMNAPNVIRFCVMVFGESALHARAVWLTMQKAACCYGVVRSLWLMAYSRKEWR